MENLRKVQMFDGEWKDIEFKNLLPCMVFRLFDEGKPVTHFGRWAWEADSNAVYPLKLKFSFY